MNYEDIYHYGFPHPLKTYFDWISTEFGYNTKEQKLLDIGYLLTKGNDIRSDIHYVYKKEGASATKLDVKNTLFILLAELWGGQFETVESMLKDYPLDKIIDIFFSHLLRYYHLPVNDQQPHYLKDPLEQTEFDLMLTNGWTLTTAQFCGNDALFDLSGKEYIYPGDEEFVRDFNSKHSEKEKFVLNTIPYPWVGNPLKAKVIILSQNPGWVENSGKIIPLMVKSIPQIAEEIMIFYRDTFRLKSHSFMPEDRKYPHFGYSSRDTFNALGDWYWSKRLHFLADELGSEDKVYENIAVIQYIPYSSVNFAPLPKTDLLPSQIFTRRLIDYIRLNCEDTIFIVPRAVKLWKSFLGNIWDTLESENRIITHLPHTYRAQYISPNCLGQDKFDRIVDILKNA